MYISRLLVIAIIFAYQVCLGFQMILTTEKIIMRGKYFLLGYLLVKLMALVCKADGEPGEPGQLGGFIMIATSNGSREESVSVATPHTEDKCRGYYDVMGQWDQPFVCKTGEYLYCCGTCGFRFCCSSKTMRLDQSTCKNYDTPVWMTPGQSPSKNNPRHDPTKDKTNLIVYIICGVVAIMALVGIFTKLGLEKAHRPQRENMSRAVASVLQGGCPEGGQINNNVGGGGPTMGQQQHPYPALSQLAQVYEQTSKELNKYASLKAVAAKANRDFYKRRLMVELPAKGGMALQTMRPTMGNMTSMNPPMTSNPMSTMNNPSLTQQMTSINPSMTSNPMTSMTPMTSLGPLSPEPVATYITEMPSIASVSSLPPERHSGPKQNGQKPKGSSGHGHGHIHGHSSSKAPGPSTSLAHMSGTMPGRSMAMGGVSSGSATMSHPLQYSSNTMGPGSMGMSMGMGQGMGMGMGMGMGSGMGLGVGMGPGMGLRGWDGTETVGRRKAYGPKRPQCTVVEQVNELHTSRGHSHSQHFLPTQPYFVTNSKTEVTV